MTLTALNRHLTDLGGVAVLWDSDVGTLVQDPTSGGNNQYGPGDLFRDAANGDIYQLGGDGSLSLFRVAAAPTVPAPAGTPAPSVAAGSAIGSAGGSWGVSQPQPGSTAAITPTGDPTKWGHQLVTWLSKASFISGMPNGLLLAAGYIGYTFMRQRRRRNPQRRYTPAGGWARDTSISRWRQERLEGTAGGRELASLARRKRSLRGRRREVSIGRRLGLL